MYLIQMQPDYEQAAAIVRGSFPESTDPAAYEALALAARLCERMAASELVERQVDAQHCLDCEFWREAAKSAGATSEFQCPKHWPRSAPDPTDEEWKHCERVSLFTSDWTCANVHVVLLRERQDLHGRLTLLETQLDTLMTATKGLVAEWRQTAQLEKRLADQTQDVGCRAAWATYERCADDIMTILK